MPPANKVTMINSLIPMIPSPIAPNQLKKGVPVRVPTMPVAAKPMSSTNMTFIPKSAKMSTNR